MVSFENTVLSISLCLVYVAWYQSRSSISTSSAYLLKNQTLHPDTYAKMKIISYVSQFFFKTTAGIWIKILGHPTRFFFISFLTSALLLMLLACFPRTAIFLVSYPLIKTLAGFARVSFLSVLKRWYPVQIMPLISSMVQILSCVGEIIARITISQLLSRLEDWKQALMMMSFIAFASAFQFATLRLSIFSKDLNKSPEGEAQRKPILAQIVEVKDLFKDAKIVIILLSMFSGSFIVSCIVSDSVNLMTFALDIKPEVSAGLDAITPACSIIGLLPTGVIFQKYLKNSKYRLVPLLLLNGLSTSLLFALYHAIKTSKINTTYTLLCLFSQHAAILSVNAILDGPYIVQLVGNRYDVIATGVVSGIGLLAGPISAMFMKDLLKTKLGWIYILYVLRFAAIGNVLLNILLFILDYKDMSTYGKEKITCDVSCAEEVQEQTEAPFDHKLDTLNPRRVW